MLADFAMLTPVLAVFAGLACGFLNTVASSGSAVSLPILIMSGLDPVSANATNRIPVLIGSLSSVYTIHRQKAMPWPLVWKAAIPATVGAVLGAITAELIPSRQFGLLITGAVLIALVLLFTHLKRAIESATAGDARFGLRENVALFAVGVWLGLIVLDGATYLLLTLTLLVGLSLAHANAVKTALLAPTTAISMVVFSYNGDIDWTLGILMGAGSLAGGMLGAGLATSPKAKKIVFPLLAVILVGEIVHLGWHYIFDTH
jgi:uncharacterized membrane protein YfcA